MTLALPMKREEAWRWFAAQAVEEAVAAPSLAAEVDPASLFVEGDGVRLVFVDGVLQGAGDLGPITVEPLDISTDHPLGRRARGTGWRLSLGADHVAGAVQIVHVATGGDNHLPGEIVLAEDAAASVTETFVGGGWTNRLTRIRLGRSARLMRAVRILGDEGFVSLRDEAEVAGGASLVSTFLAQGRGSRIDVAATLIGEGAFAEVGGALLARETDAQEAAVVIRHEAPNCMSRQVWRLLAADKAQASAAARVEVARDAQKTDGMQSLRGLLLDRTATVNLKPELEIFADDVKCAHGATVGELDRNALFYLESRGLPPAHARALLSRAFVGDALERIGPEAVREAFAADADSWLGAAL